jgi:hypothetical protein
MKYLQVSADAACEKSKPANIRLATKHLREIAATVWENMVVSWVGFGEDCRES